MTVFFRFLVVLIVIACCYSTGTLYSQNKQIVSLANIKDNSPNDSISKYYHFVYKAENQIIKGNFKNAAKLYEKAFTYIEHPFAQDLNFALKCEFLNPYNDDNIKKYVYLMILKTGNKNRYLEDSKYQELDSWESVQLVIDTTQAIFDTTVLSQLQDFAKYDQEFRLNCREEYGCIYNEFTIDTINVIDSIHFYKIVDILKGLDYVSEETISNHGWRPIELILMHNRGRYQIFDVLLKSVLNGKFDSRKYACALSDANYQHEGRYPIGLRSNGFQIGLRSNEFQINKQCYLYIKPSLKQKLKTKQFRKLLYMESPKYFHKKRIWQMQEETPSFNLRTLDEIVLQDEKFYSFILESKRKFGQRIYFMNKEAKKTITKEARAWKKKQKKLKKEIAE
ncbi:MAG: hypothetical protein PHW82_15230 [Bacteroidales bacterium]|nr:hypothetical protein [Bacteroidales bacterium]MDY0142352.1 hypothetical protein [Bacteroidales bacterium]